MPYTSPTDVSGLQVWYKADQITGLSDGDPVSTWQDQSGNSRDLTAAGSTRPTYKVNIVNGKAVVRFAAAKALSTGVIAALNFGATNPFSVFVVIRPTDVTTFGTVCGCRNDNGNGGAWHYAMKDTSANPEFIFFGSTSGLFRPRGRSVVANNTAFIWYGESAGGGATTSVKFSQGGVLVDSDVITSSLNGTVITNQEFTVGGHLVGVSTYGESLVGDIGEIMVFNKQLSVLEHDALFQYLYNRWVGSLSRTAAGTRTASATRI